VERPSVLVAGKSLKAELPFEELGAPNKAVVDLSVSLIVADQAECDETAKHRNAKFVMWGQVRTRKGRQSSPGQ
jgi:hypothetical protein